MNTNFISATQVQRNAKSVFSSDTPFQVVLNNNELNWVVLNKKFSKVVLDSGALEQILEELEELNDKETLNVTSEHRNWKSQPVDFEELLQKNGI